MKEDDAAPLRRSRRERKSNRKFLTDDSGAEDSDSGQNKLIKPPTAAVTSRGRDPKLIHSKTGKPALNPTIVRDADPGSNKPLKLTAASVLATTRDSEFEHTKTAKQVPASARTSLQSRTSSDKNSTESSVVDGYDKHTCSIPLRKPGVAAEFCYNGTKSQLDYSQAPHTDQGSFFNVRDSPPVRSYIGDSLKNRHITYLPHPIRDGFDLFINHLEQFDPNCWEDPSAVLDSLLADLQKMKYSYALHRAMRLKAGFDVASFEPHRFNVFYYDTRNDLLKSAMTTKDCITIDGDLVPFQHPAAVNESMVSIVKEIRPEADESPHLLLDIYCADSDEQTLSRHAHSRVSKLEKKKHRPKLKKESRKSQSRVKTLGFVCQKASSQDAVDTARKPNDSFVGGINELQKTVGEEKADINALEDERAQDMLASAGGSDVIAEVPHKKTKPAQDLQSNRYTDKHILGTQRTGSYVADRKYYEQTTTGVGSHVSTTQSCTNLEENAQVFKAGKTEELHLSQDNSDNRGKNDKCKQSHVSGSIAHVGYRGPNLHFGYKSSAAAEPAVHHYGYGAFKKTANGPEERPDPKLSDFHCNDSDMPLDNECFGASPISDISQD